MGSHREGRQQRTEQPVQPGATGEGRKKVAGPKEARDKTLHRRGKTRKHTREDR